MSKQICHAHCPREGGGIWPVILILAAVVIIPPAFTGPLILLAVVPLVLVASLAVVGRLKWKRLAMYPRWYVAQPQQPGAVTYTARTEVIPPARARVAAPPQRVHVSLWEPQPLKGEIER